MNSNWHSLTSTSAAMWNKSERRCSCLFVSIVSSPSRALPNVVGFQRAADASTDFHKSPSLSSIFSRNVTASARAGDFVSLLLRTSSCFLQFQYLEQMKTSSHLFLRCVQSMKTGWLNMVCEVCAGSSPSTAWETIQGDGAVDVNCDPGFSKQTLFKKN